MKKRMIYDLKNREIFKKKEINRIGCLVSLRSNKLSFLENIKNCNKNNVNWCKIHNNCYLTNRSKGIFRLTRLSRLKFKELCNYGLILGIYFYKW